MMKRSVTFLMGFSLLCLCMIPNLRATQDTGPTKLAEEMLELADNAFSSGNVSQAMELYISILKDHPGHLQALQMAGYIAYKSRSFDNAELYFKRMLESHGESFTPHFHLGNIYFTRSLPVKALEHYNKALALNPDDPLLKGNIQLTKETIQAAKQLKKLYTRSTHVVWLGAGAGLLILLSILYLELRSLHKQR